MNIIQRYTNGQKCHLLFFNFKLGTKIFKLGVIKIVI